MGDKKIMKIEKIKKKLYERTRLDAIIAVVTLIFLLFIGRLFYWQIILGYNFREQSEKNYSNIIKTDAIRGEILDANGIPFVLNDTKFKIVLNRLNLNKEDENGVILYLVNLLNSRREKWNDVLPIEINSQGEYEFVKDNQAEVSNLKRVLVVNSYATAKNCMEKMINDFSCSGYSKEEQRILCSVKYNMTKSGYYYSKTLPYTFASDINKETVSIISEKSNILKGVEIRTSTQRKYENGTIASHIIGTVGALSKEEYDRLKDSYKLNDVIGKSGVEKAMEDYLRGEEGKTEVILRRDGTIKYNKLQQVSPGSNVYLTLDYKLQDIANRSLAKHVNEAKAGHKDCVGGAVVVLNVKDFSVLAASTYPTYNLDLYMKDPNYYASLMKDNINTPLLNRAFDGAFAPGSIYKPVVACAGLQEGVVDEKSTILCTGRYYYPGSNQYLSCMGVHGGLTVRKALAKSCNVFFSELGRRLGIDKLYQHSRSFGLGDRTGIEIGESKGILASPEYAEKNGITWRDANTSQAAIGQSFNLFTPLQLATYTATIANKGKRYKTHIIKKVTDYTGQNVIFENDPNNPVLAEEVNISEENFNIVREGMREVTTAGTAMSFANYGIKIGAKTGTAEVPPKSDHTTFICFAPFDEPEIAIAVVVQHGAVGSFSTRIARDIMDYYFFKKEDGVKVEEQK